MSEDKVEREGGEDQPTAATMISLTALVSPEKPTTNNNQSSLHFCVVCQAYTADTAILTCGHVCLCNEHTVVMSERNQLSNCPVCKMEVTGVCRLKG